MKDETYTGYVLGSAGHHRELQRRVQQVEERLAEPNALVPELLSKLATLHAGLAASYRKQAKEWK